MEHQQDKMAVLLDKAEVGFQKAALMFQDAVTEFAFFRDGIIDAQEIKQVTGEVAQAQSNLTDAETSLGEYARRDP